MPFAVPRQPAEAMFASPASRPYETPRAEKPPRVNVNSLRSAPTGEKVRFGLLMGLIAACFLWGGGSRFDIPGLILLQPLAILIGAALIVVPGDIRWRAVGTPLLLLAALAIVMIVQLIPLPPSLWRALPGHDQLWQFAEAGGATESWRPLSLTPDQTLGSLIGLAIPAAGLIGFASLPEDRTHKLLPYLLIAAALSIVAGLGQLVGGPQSGFYRYSVTNIGAAVGLFSNRNHQALFLAMTWPMLALWATRRGLDPQQKRLRRWIAGAGAVALIPMITATGSRAGLVLGAIGIFFAWRLIRLDGRRSGEAPTRFPALARAAPVLIVLAVIVVGALAFSLSRAEAIQRLFSTNLAEESRLVYLPVLVRIAGDFLPFGTGFGSFDPVFRYYEPDALLAQTYLNHAHNDLVELLITGGLPALGILILFVLWAGRRAVGLRRRLPGSARERFAFLALAFMTLMLIASIVDYPLRTPIHALLFAFASGWLASLPDRRQAAERG